jgi:hypothetical protein
MKDVYILRTSVSFTNKTKFYNIIKINQNAHWKILKELFINLYFIYKSKHIQYL